MNNDLSGFVLRVGSMVWFYALVSYILIILLILHFDDVIKDADFILLWFSTYV